MIHTRPVFMEWCVFCRKIAEKAAVIPKGTMTNITPYAPVCDECAERLSLDDVVERLAIMYGDAPHDPPAD